MATKFQDYYQILGIERSATQDDVQRAYRTLARKFHPDVNKEPGAEQRFKEIGEAYEVLKDPAKRSRYDALGSNWRAGEEFRPPPGWRTRAPGGSGGTGGVGTGGAGGFSDFFESIFGGEWGGGGSSGGFDVEEFIRSAGGGASAGRGGGGGGPGGRGRATRPRAGADHEAELTITLAEAVRGGIRQINVASSDGEPSHSYDVKIPPGVTHGSVIRLSGQGGPGRQGGSPGDLLLKIRIAPDPRFRIERDHDLATVVKLTPAEAALGAKVEVPIIDAAAGGGDGRVILTIPPGSQSGQRLRIRGHGLTKRSGDRGDLFAELRIVVPHTLSDEERAAYEQLARVTRASPRHGA